MLLNNVHMARGSFRHILHLNYKKMCCFVVVKIQTVQLGYIGHMRRNGTSAVSKRFLESQYSAEV